MRVVFLLLTACLCFLRAHPLDTEDGHYMNKFLIELHKRETAEALASDHGFEIEDHLEDLGYHVLTHKDVSSRSKRSAEHHVQKLLGDSRVKFAKQEKELIRVKREIIHDKQNELHVEKITDNSIYYRSATPRLVRKDGIPNPVIEFNDPFYPDQWYTHNNGQTGGVPDVDMNVIISWKMGYTGKNINICILDDGVDHTHKDIKDNYRADLSADLNDKHDDDPMPDMSNSDNSHGTRCAGEIVAKADNGVCGVGIAYDAKIGGIRILDGPISDSLEAKGLNHKNQDAHLYSASWGPRDDGMTLEAPGEASIRAIKKGVKEGRGGKGNIFVWASGNGGAEDDDCNCDGYVGMKEAISIGSITDRGLIPYFMEECPSTFAVVPSGGDTLEDIRQSSQRGNVAGNDKPKIKVVTTDVNQGCIENFVGTSAAAPLAAGCIALVLDANEDLTYRDVQHIVAKGSRIPAVTNDWIVNGGGYHRSQKFGFGVMDCSLMVELGLNWEHVGDEVVCESQLVDINKEVQADSCVTEFIDMSSCQSDPSTHIENLEHSRLYVEVDSNRRGDVSIVLTSPFGTMSEMLSTRKNDKSGESIIFEFSSLNNWGENIVGDEKWKLEVCDNAKTDGNNVKFNKYKLILSGTADKRTKRSTASFQPSEAAIAEMKDLEIKRGRRISIKRNSEVNKKESEKTTENSTEKKDQQKYLKDVIHDVSSYLQRKGFKENHVLDILNNGMAASSEVKKGHESNRGLSQRQFGEKNIDHDKFIDGMSRAVGDIFEERKIEKERRERQRENEKREEIRKEMEKKKAIERRNEMVEKLQNEKRAEELKLKQRIAESRKANEVMEELKERYEKERDEEKKRKEQIEQEKEEREGMVEKYIESYLDGDDSSPEEIDAIMREVRNLLENRK